MKPTHRTLAAGCLLLGVTFLFAGHFDDPAPPEEKSAPVAFDIRQPQSPPRPAPEWFKRVDQGQTNPRLKGYFTPEGVRMEIVAEEPTVINPVGITFGDDGTLHVIEWRPSPGDEWRETPVTFTYKDGSTRQVATMQKKVKDVIKTLRDTDGDGVYDAASVVLEEELPSSLLLHDGWMYVASRGSVRRYRQSKPGGPYDQKEVIAQGFCGFHHHQVSGMTIGNDGWLYITSGDDDNFVEGSDGSRATVLRTGAVFRCRPDGSRMQVYATGFRNPYRDVAFDAAFNMFHVDNDNEDGSKFTGCRLMHITEGNDFGWRLRQGARCCVPDHVRGAVFGELPGKTLPLLKTGRGAPAGLLIYNDTRFPDRYRWLLLYPDVFRKLIRAYRVEQRGSTFEVTEAFEFLKSDDPLFRPCQMVIGPDGAIYVCDWRTDSGGAGRLWGDGRHGRVYRLTWAGTEDEPALPPRPMDSWARITKLSDEELLKTLAAPDFTDRQHAQRELGRRGDRNRPALLKMLEDLDLPVEARIATLGVLSGMWNDAVEEAVMRIMEQGEEEVRRLAADTLGLRSKPGSERVHAALLHMLGDPIPSVRRSVALAMGHVAAPAAPDNLANALAFDEGTDANLREGLIRAIEILGKPGLQRLLSLADSGDSGGLERVVAAFLTMRTRPAAEMLPVLLRNPHLSTTQRTNLVRSFNNYLLDPPLSLTPLLEYLHSTTKVEKPVLLAALEVLSLGNAMRDRETQSWLLGMLNDPSEEIRVSVIRAVEDGRLTAAGPELVHMLARAGRSSAEKLALVRALAALNEASAVPVLKQTVEAAGDQLTLKLEALRTLAGLNSEAARAVARPLLTNEQAGLRRQAVEVLGITKEGACEVGQLFLDRKLPRELLPQVSEALRKHAGRDVASSELLAKVMKSGLLVSFDPAEVQRIRQLVGKQGNAERGKALYLNATNLACINCHRLEGLGGNVGPDLTRVWESQSVEKIIESLVEPSREIKEGYQAYVASTKKGQVFTGLKVAQTAEEVVLREANGREVRLPTTEIEELGASKQSLMPDNVVGQLSFDQFIDLVAFLRSREAQESLRGVAADFWVVGPFPADLKAAEGPEKATDQTETYAVPGQDRPVAWQPLAAESTGRLNLKAAFGKDNIAAYAMTFVFSPKAQKAQMLMGSDDEVRIWLNGRQVHEYPLPRSAVPDQDRVQVTLNAGWNRVLAKVVNGQVDHALYLRFTGAEGLRITRQPDAR